MTDPHIRYIDEVEITGKTILLRADFDVSLNPDFSIADDARIKQNIPTIIYLLKEKNKVICIAKLGRPKGRDPKYSLKVVVDRLKTYLPNYNVELVDDFLSQTGQTQIKNQSDNTILLLENIRFYPEEKNNDNDFAEKLSKLGNIFVNDGFAVSHRSEASVVGIPKFIPSYGGLLLKREIQMISKVLENPKKPLIAIIGGAKVSTKIGLLDKLASMSDHVLIGGGLANTFLKAQGMDIGESFYEKDHVEDAKKLLSKTNIILPHDVVVGNKNTNETMVMKLTEVPHDKEILDIGPQTQALFGSYITKAKTIIWNGPVGYIENPQYRRGTDFIYFSIAENHEATSIVGGGDTIAAISKKEYLDKITHVSTGGGAMLEMIEKGTLPGIDALKQTTE